MDNEITIDIEKIKNSPDNSIKDFETIRQISLYGIKTGDSSLYCKVYEPHSFAGLYPFVMKQFEKAPEVYEKIEKEFSKENISKYTEILEDLFKKRKK